MAECNIFVGNIGTGKSTIARKFALMGQAVVNMDDIQQGLAGGIYDFYDMNKKPVYTAMEEIAIEESLKNGISVCIDRTNMDRKRRTRFIDIAKRYTDNINCYDFGAGNEGNLMNRIANSRGVHADKWTEIFNYMKSSYEKPDISEGFKNIITTPERFEFHAFDFDGCIVKNNFPEIGEIVNGTVEHMNDLFQDLKNIIIVWTCRSGDYEFQMRNFLLKKKIPFDFINENPIFDTGSNKIFAHNYYDDRNRFI